MTFLLWLIETHIHELEEELKLFKNHSQPKIVVSNKSFFYFLQIPMACLKLAIATLAFCPRRSMARASGNLPSPRRYKAIKPSPECASRHGAKGESHFKHRNH
ncbi:hypothetical protein Bca101_010693 [Brassica carinata]